MTERKLANERVHVRILQERRKRVPPGFGTGGFLETAGAGGLNERSPNTVEIRGAGIAPDAAMNASRRPPANRLLSLGGLHSLPDGGGQFAGITSGQWQATTGGLVAQDDWPPCSSVNQPVKNRCRFTDERNRSLTPRLGLGAEFGPAADVNPAIAKVNVFDEQPHEFARPQAQLGQEKMDTEAPLIRGLQECQLRCRIEDEDRLRIFDARSLAAEPRKRVLRIGRQVSPLGGIGVQ
jgi:hypothetical protein